MHAGMHRTGSTSIQEYLRLNASFFKDKNIQIMTDLDVFDLGVSKNDLSENCFRIAHVLIDKQLHTPMRIHGEAKVLPLMKKMQTIQALNRRLIEGPCDRVILSAEAFSFLRSRCEKFWLNRMISGLCLKPVVFFRNKTDWLRSWQAWLSANVPNWISERKQPGSIFDLSETSWLVDHDAIRRFYARDGMFLSYEDSVSEYGSVIPVFLNSLELDLAECPPWEGIWANDSASKMTSTGVESEPLRQGN